MIRNCIIYSLSLIFIHSIAHTQSKSNYSIFGNLGLIETPTARFGNDKDIGLTVTWLPEKYRVLRAKPIAAPEFHYNLDIIFLPFLEVTATLIRPTNMKEQPWGIGDRSFKIKLKLLEEKVYTPAIAFGIHDPGGANTNSGAVYFNASKKFVLQDNIKIDSHIGYGFDISTPFWEKSHLFSSDGEKNHSRLSGIFGGVEVSYKKFNFLTEYDTDKFNCGAGFFLLNEILIRIVYLNMEVFSISITVELY